MKQSELDLEDTSFEALVIKLKNATRKYDDLKAEQERALHAVGKEVAEAALQLRAVCPHPEDKIERRYTDVPGSYYDRSEHTEWRVCTVCKAESERVVTHGGFG